MTLTWTNERRRLGDLVPWPRNPRQIRKAQADRLVDSFATFGQVETLAVGPDGDIYNGHQRLNVLIDDHGPDYEVDVRVASRPLTEKEREKLTVYLHRGAAGEWDFDMLANEFDALELLEWGFDERELDWFKPASDVDAEPQVDRAEELREAWGVEPGQMWQLGEHRLVCGDCTDAAVVERVMGGEKAMLTATDPPYGIDVVPDNGEIGWSTKQAKVSKFAKVVNDDKSMDVSFLLGTASRVAIFGGNYFAHYLPKAGRWLVWDKDFTDAERDFVPFSECELVWTNIEGVAVKKYRCRSMGYSREGESGSRMHPNQKPIKVMAGIINDFSGGGDVIYDPFLGSGTTLIACERLGRRCRAVEISPAYVAVTLQRYQDATGITPTLVTP